MEFHIARAVREKLELDDLLFSYSGNVMFANVAASRKLAQKLNEVRGEGANPAGAVNAGALFAMGLIDELNHALVARYRTEIDPPVLAEAVRWFASLAPAAEVERLLLEFAEQFPNREVYQGELTAAEWLAGSTEGMSNREAALEELLLLWIANSNPACKPFQELFEDEGLERGTIYTRVTEAFPNYFDTRPPMAVGVGSLLDALRAPILASPDSLTGQLEFIRQNWTQHLGEGLKRVLLAIDTLREEDVAIWMRFHPPAPDRFEGGAQGGGHEGFVGDEYVGFEGEFIAGRDGVRHRRYATDYQAPLNEYEAFSADQAWMPNVVLMAKSTYVWLEQLSQKYGWHIHRLDQIPQEELDLMASRGITGLWLIGLWERSVASQTIKRLRGHADAVASAYSLKRYSIAEDLGGNAGYEQLKHKAALAGLRLASDMVPNHMGIDSDWVVEHPDWFISRPESPFPSYNFEGPDLSNDSRVEIKIEDHYYDQTDAAVVFRLRHHGDGATRYMYHGNDGTSFAWNDTAQLDYSKASVREHVIQTILHVARLFPIIRFDAAMVLAKRHVQRLWFPLPGAGGSIPSRAEDAMSQEEFEALMPNEFWREVVDRVAVEVPGTLLLAEAFWLLEGYFVRTLGMHRVYNSAFMNMLRDEENAKYRSYLKKTIEFDPDIMKRYVNFMSNPDERTAIDQFGSGDKYFGVSTLLATLPGLPMFGHGQIEGFTERYGMEYKQAKMIEWPDEHLVARHQAEIAPLLKNRRIFAESENFKLYDFRNEHGADENVFAYSNRMGDERSVVIYNNGYEATHGTIHQSASSMDKGSGELQTHSLAEALGLPCDDMVVAYRDHRSGLEFLQRGRNLSAQGLTLSLQGYQCAVLLDWQPMQSTAEYPWDRLCDELRGAGVPNLEERMSRLRLHPLHQALREAISATVLETLAADIAAASTNATLDNLTPVLEPLYWRFAELGQGGGSPGAQRYLSSLRSRVLEVSKVVASLRDVVPPAGLALLPAIQGDTKLALAPLWAGVLMGALPWSDDVEGEFDSLGIRTALGETFADLGMQGDANWRAAARVRMLALGRWTLASVTETEFWADGDARWLAGVNESDSVSYFNQEQFEELVTWLAVSAAAATDTPTVVEAACSRAKKSGYRLDRFLAASTPEATPILPKTTMSEFVADDPKATAFDPQLKAVAEAMTPTPTAKQTGIVGEVVYGLVGMIASLTE